MKYSVKKTIVLTILMAVCVSVFAVPEIIAEESADTKPAAAMDVDAFSDMDEISYCLGLDMGISFKEMGIKVNPRVLLRGMQDGLSGAEPLLSEEKRQGAQSAFEDIMMERQMEMMAAEEEMNAALAAKNKKEGEQFLAENKKKEGVLTTESGLQYIVLKEGNGDKPKAEDTVTVNYRGTLLDGTEFDSSYERKQPATFALDGVVPGWREGIQLMSPGATFKFFMPPGLAYGLGGVGDVIGPEATLIFEVELIEVKPAEKNKQE